MKTNVTPTRDEFARGSNQSGMRAHNERLVLTLIRQMGPLAKSEIARLTGLSAQTVSVIMRSLEAEGLLEKGEPVRGKVGQPSVPMGLAAEGAFFLGLKVGRRSLDLVLTDFLGQIRGRVHLNHRFPEPNSVVRFANDSIAQLVEQLPEAHRQKVAGLGIAIPFQLWDWAEPLGVSQSAMDVWRKRDIRAEIAEDWDFAVFLQNDASAACGAELVFGDKDKPRDFLYFFIGFFVGGGVVLNNNLFTGQTGNAGALGSIPINRDGPNVQQLVDVASLASLERQTVEAGGNGDMIWNNPKSWTVPLDILDEWVKLASESLAFAIASSVSLIDFECIIIDGWMPEDVRAQVVCATRAALDKIDIAGITPPKLRAGTIGSDARALGAASLPLSERFLVDRSSFLKTPL